MTTLRDIFHSIANWHNKITVASGCTKEIMKIKPLDKLTKEELKIQQEKLVDLLGKIETDAVNANKQVEELKNSIYKKMGPETTL
ncbi:MAG: hypothetical protein NTV07_01495 [Candidatus Omnitrophica bacterium]|nr:hypothetical protein [Candidatus Omnitrophota bacterium]